MLSDLFFGLWVVGRCRLGLGRRICEGWDGGMGAAIGDEMRWDAMWVGVVLGLCFFCASEVHADTGWRQRVSRYDEQSCLEPRCGWCGLGLKVLAHHCVLGLFTGPSLWWVLWLSG